MKPLTIHFQKPAFQSLLPSNSQFGCFIFCTVLLNFSATLSNAQTIMQPSNLIFDPLPINVELLEESDGSNNISITEQARPQNVSSADAALTPPQFALQSNQAATGKSIEQYQQAILELELEGGPYNNNLGEQLVALGSAYQTEGEHDQAIEVFNQAIHISRVNNGLFTLQQTPIIERIIQSHLAHGDLTEANDQFEYLFYLQNKAYQPTDPELLPALTAYAEWNIFAYSLNNGSQLKTNTSATGEEQFVINRLINAQNIYSSIIQILLNNYGFTDPRLLVMEKNLALTNYFFASMINVGRNPFNNTVAGAGPTQSTFADASMINSSYRNGQEALERRVNYMRSSRSQTNTEVATALIELGDWHLTFSKRKSALEAYAAAYQELADSNISDTAINAIMRPDLSIPIPAFIPGRFSKAAHNIPENAPLNYQGYIDLEFTVDRYGSPSSIKVLSRSTPKSDIESMLIREIRRSRFRPRLVKGEPIDKDLFQQRYYYAY